MENREPEDDDFGEEEEKPTPWRLLVALLGGVAVIGGVCGLVVFRLADAGAAPMWSTLGTLLQGIAGTVALVLLGWTVYLQQRELALQRKELRRSWKAQLQTGEELRGARMEQRRLADQSREQVRQTREHIEVLRRQMRRPLMPVLHAKVYDNRDRRARNLRVDLSNFLQSVGRVTAVRFTADGRTVERLQDLIPWLSAPACDVASGQERLPFLVNERGTNAITLCSLSISAHGGGGVPESAETVVDRFASIELEVDYEDVLGTKFKPLKCRLAPSD